MVNEARSKNLAQRTLHWFTGTGVTPTMLNTPLPYVYGRCAFRDIADALATATDASDRIYILGWWVDPNTKLIDSMPPVFLRDRLAGTKAHVRGMFWDSPQKNPVNGNREPDNEPIVSFLNGLRNGAGILDSKLPFFRFVGAATGMRGGVHHQKLLVIRSAAGLIGFTGGMDINNERVAVSPGGFQPLHDVHLRITGPAARSLLDVFSQRWLDHPESVALDQAKFGMSALQAKLDFADVRARPLGKAPVSSSHQTKRRSNENQAVGVGRTYANLHKFNENETYSFATAGETTAWRLISTGVANARHFIYIEDQYFISRRLKSALLAKLREPQFKFLLVLMQESQTFDHSTNLLANEIPFLIAARNEIRTDFASVDPERRKWGMFSLKSSPDPRRQQWCGSYVHAKVQIYDDEAAIIGTANANDRGYSFDTEIVTCVTDDALGQMIGGTFCA